MAHIKCRYSTPYCTHYINSGYLSKFEFTVNCGHENCKYYANNTKRIGASCSYQCFKSGEFEEDVERYEYVDGELKVHDVIYAKYEIEYLEIDGRVLVNKTEESYGDY